MPARNGAESSSPVQPHQARHSLDDLIVACAIAVLSFLPEPGDAGVNQPRILCRKSMVIDAEPMLDARPEILDNDVGSSRQPSDDFNAARILKVDRDASLVAMKICRVVEHPLLRLPARPLHTKDVCAKIGKDLRACGAGSNGGEIHYEKRERARSLSVTRGVYRTHVGNRKEPAGFRLRFR